MQQATLLISVRPEPYINDVTNINFTDNKANVKGNCNKDYSNILARACVCVRVCAQLAVNQAVYSQYARVEGACVNMRPCVRLE